MTGELDNRPLDELLAGTDGYALLKHPDGRTIGVIHADGWFCARLTATDGTTLGDIRLYDADMRKGALFARTRIINRLVTARNERDVNAIRADEDRLATQRAYRRYAINDRTTPPAPCCRMGAQRLPDAVYRTLRADEATTRLELADGRTITIRRADHTTRFELAAPDGTTILTDRADDGDFPTRSGRIMAAASMIRHLDAIPTRQDTHRYDMWKRDSRRMRLRMRARAKNA